MRRFARPLASRLKAASAAAGVAVMLTSRRCLSSYVFYRLPPEGIIPTHAPDGAEVEAEKVIGEMKNLAATLLSTQLVDSFHEMQSVPYWDGIRQDVVVVGTPGVLVMPKRGIEHRSAEMSETVRYLKSQNMNSDILNYLQDDKRALARASDVIALEESFLMAWGNSRTNEIAFDLSYNAHTNSGGAQGMVCMGFQSLPDAPPLNEYCAYAGNRFMIVTDDKHGARAEYFLESINERVGGGVRYTPIRVPSGCQFVSWCIKNLICNDVLVDEDYPEAMDILSRAGMSPIPVQWKECKRLGIHMRSVLLHASFVPYGADSSAHGHHEEMARPMSTYESVDGTRNSGNKLTFEVQQKGLTLDKHCETVLQQLQSGVIPTPVFQRTPRYRPKRRPGFGGVPRIGTGDEQDPDPASPDGLERARARQMRNRLAIEASTKEAERRAAAKERDGELGTNRFNVNPVKDEYKGVPPESIGATPVVDGIRNPDFK